MHQAYSQALRNHSKAAFDSFKRQERVVISCGDQDVINTCGQANLIRWAIRHEVLEHMQDHLSAVKADLRQSTHKEAKQKAEGGRALKKPVGIKKLSPQQGQETRRAACGSSPLQPSCKKRRSSSGPRLVNIASPVVGRGVVFRGRYEGWGLCGHRVLVQWPAQHSLHVEREVGTWCQGIGSPGRGVEHG